MSVDGPVATKLSLRSEDGPVATKFPPQAGTKTDVSLFT